ncbi:MAG: hypothetical protein V9H69_10485 [Anaerolineae bacterium]
MAELGGAVLLTVLGQRAEADWGGAYHYIKSYAKAKDGEGLLREVMQVTRPHGRGRQAHPGRGRGAAR